MINLHLKKECFNEVYLPYLFDYSHTTEVYYGGSASGKSVHCGMKILIKLLNSAGRKALVIRKTLASQKQSCWALMQELLEKWQLWGETEAKESQFKMVLPNGSEILFRGLEDPERIKSIVGITDVWVEEATELDYEDYLQLRLRLRAKADNLQILLSFNPVSKANWCYKEFFAKPTDAFILKTTYKDNKFCSETFKEYVESLIESDPVYYRVYALGEFCSLNKTVYNNWKVSDEEPPKDGQLICGLDFGFVNDLTAFVAAVVKDRTIYVFKTWGDTGKTNEEIAQIITAMGFSKSTIIADSAEPKSIEEMRRAGLQRIKPSVKGGDSIIHGIQQLQGYKILVRPECQGIITEFENYSWQKDRQTGEYINKPEDSMNHYCDSLRYAIQGLGNKVKVFDKSILGL